MYDVAYQMIMQNAVDVNNIDKNGNNSLHYLLSKFDKKHIIVQQMCDIAIKKYGCNINEVNNNGYSPFLYAVKKGQIEAIKYVIKFNSNNYKQFNVHSLGGKE